MSRRIFTLANQRLVDKCIAVIREAFEQRPGSRVEVKGPKRSHDQNGKMHAMLGDIAEQLTHYGQTLDVEDWKDVFMDELQRDHRQEARYARGLYGAGIVPLGRSTSDLDVAEFSDLITLIYAFGDSHGVVWSEPKPKDDRPVPPIEAYEDAQQLSQDGRSPSPTTSAPSDSRTPASEEHSRAEAASS